MTTYRVKNILGQAMITPDLKIALWHYCYGRRCVACQLVKDAAAGEACHECDDAELLRRFGAEIEIGGLVAASNCITHKRSNEARILIGDPQRELGPVVAVSADLAAAPVQKGLESVLAPKAEDDPVNHPTHYTHGGVECIDAIEAALSSQTDPTNAFLTGQAIKYLWRWPVKNGLEDLRKAKWYLDRLIGKVEG